MKPRITCVVLVLAMLSAACNMPGSIPATPTADANAMLTEVAGTIQAMTSATPTGHPTQPAGEATPPGLAQTNTTAPTQTQAIKPSDTPRPCDQAQFLSDVTIPDGTQMTSGQVFTKTWRLRNIGTCSWGEGYAVVFASGEAMGAPAAVNLPGDVSPDSTVDISIEFKAPAAPGDYRSSWRLRNPAGQVFGVFDNQPFFVQISVVQPTVTVTPTVAITPTITPPATGIIYDFASNVCRAEWRTQAGVLTCPGTSGGSQGYVMRLQNQQLETGQMENDPIVLTVPQAVPDGAITGRFPVVTIQNGYHFKATIGCLGGMSSCSVIYQVNYSANGGPPQNLIEREQTYDGSIQGIDIDLSSLAGQPVEMILVVLAGGQAEEDQAVWIYPRIVKQ
jgi:hypothetical protein